MFSILKSGRGLPVARYMINNHATYRNKVLSTNTAHSSKPVIDLKVLYTAAMATDIILISLQ